LTKRIREKGMPHGVIAHYPEGKFDIPALQKKAADWAGLVGLDLAIDATVSEAAGYTTKQWTWTDGFTNNDGGDFTVVVIDYGVKQNILRALNDVGAKVRIVPAKTSAADILALKPDGILLSN